MPEVLTIDPRGRHPQAPFLAKGGRSARSQICPRSRIACPPGQTRSDGFPILHEGTPPRLSHQNWDLHLFGLVDEERRLDWEAFLSLPQSQVVSDFHCVTRWSNFDNVWEGVLFRDLVDRIGIKDEARHVMAYGHLNEHPTGYDSNIPLDVLMDADVLLAHRHNGQPLTPDHGFPVRLVVPKRYAWKSVKWLRALEFMAEDRRGYWEARGYHNNAEPFAEERYSHQERPSQRMHVRGKDYT